MSNEFQVGSYESGSFGGSSYKKREYFKLKENSSNLFTILPPMGSLAKNKKLFAYYATYFLAGTNGKKKPIVSIQRMNGNKEVIQRCPLHDKVESLIAKVKSERQKLELNPKDPSVNVSLLESMELTLKDLRIDKGYYFNAITPSGSIGILKLRKTAKQALEERFKQLEQLGLNPITDGIVFDIRKNKIDGKVSYSVDIARKTFKNAEGKIISEEMTNPLTEVTINRLKNGEAADLGKLYRVLTEQELKLLATLDPKAVDTVFANPESVSAEEFSDDFDDETSDSVQAVNAAISSPVASFVTAQESAPRATPAPVTPVQTAAAASTQASKNSVEDIVSQFLKGE